MLMNEVDQLEYARLKMLDGLRQDIIKVMIGMGDYLIHTDYKGVTSGGENMVDLRDRLSHFVYNHDKGVV